MKKTARIVALCCAHGLLITNYTTHAALIDRGNGMVYDEDRNITWLADANLAASNTFGISGINNQGWMPWSVAQEWIGAMNSYGGSGYLGFSDWRLPYTVQPDLSCDFQSLQTGESYGNYCTGSEMGHLFYEELSGIAGLPPSGGPDSVLNLFTNVQKNVYWSSEYTDNTGYAWNFGFHMGYQRKNPKSEQYHVWVVRDGDVLSTVPIPGGVWLFASGLIGLVSVLTRQQRRST